MDPLRMPNITGNTPEDRINQIHDFLFQFTILYNNTISELEHEVQKLKEANNGNVH